MRARAAGGRPWPDYGELTIQRPVAQTRAALQTLLCVPSRRHLEHPTPRCADGRSRARAPPLPSCCRDPGGPCPGTRHPAQRRGVSGRTTSAAQCPCQLDSQIMVTSLRPGRISATRQVPAQIRRPEYVGKKYPKIGEPNVKDPETIAAMRVAGRIAAQALAEVGRHVEPRVTTDELEPIGHELLIDPRAYPSTLGYRGYPKSLRASLDEVICHGIPVDTLVADGDIANIYITTYIGDGHEILTLP